MQHLSVKGINPCFQFVEIGKSPKNTLKIANDEDRIGY